MPTRVNDSSIVMYPAASPTKETKAMANGGVASAMVVQLHFVLPCHVNMRAPSVCILMLCDSDVMSVIFGSFLGSDVVRGRLENGADGSNSLRCS